MNRELASSGDTLFARLFSVATTGEVVADDKMGNRMVDPHISHLESADLLAAGVGVVPK